jgi:hypothetical protein
MFAEQEINDLHVQYMCQFKGATSAMFAKYDLTPSQLEFLQSKIKEGCAAIINGYKIMSLAWETIAVELEEKLKCK